MEQSLKSQQAEKDKRRKETTDAVNRLQKTEVDAVRVANQIGAINSELADVQRQIREKRNQVLDSADKAGAADSAVVKGEEKKTAERRGSVEATEKRTIAEQQKAERIKPSDKRIMDAGGVAKVLRDAGAELKKISRDLQTIESGAREKRTKAVSQIEGAITRNRK